MSASTFKAHCFDALERVRRHGTEIVITRRGKPVARLVPLAEAPVPQGLLGLLKGAGETAGDIVSPTGDDWSLDE